MDKDKLNEIVRLHQMWVYNEAVGQRANLEGVSLLGASLLGANLGRANLEKANLWGANLLRVNLRGANLLRANLGRANLEGANLLRANLEGASLLGANLLRANFEGANLGGANLGGANLGGANLGGANLERANLERANLEGVNLERANLERVNLERANLVNTIYENMNWLAWMGIISDSKGYARAYKLIDQGGEGIFQGGLNYFDGTIFEVPKVDRNEFMQCSYGINLATFKWCLNNRQGKSNRLLLMKFKVSDAICPVASDGKFRVRKCSRVGEVDWNNNLLKENK